MLKTPFHTCCCILFAAIACVSSLPGCSSHIEDTGTETHWLKACDSDADCNGPTSCLCGVCTITCEVDNSCPDQAPQCLVPDDDSCAGGASESICAKERTETVEAGGASVEPGGSDSNEPFSWNTYIEVLCNFYTTCSPTLRGAYGDREQCLTYTQNLYAQDPTRLPTFLEAGWDAECLADLGRLDCPQGIESADDLQKYWLLALVDCSTPDLMGCNDNDDCFDVWECSATDGTCGSCQGSAPGTCRNNFDCPVGEHCMGEVCAPLKPAGSACSDYDECQSGRCEGVCVAIQPQGGNCTATTDCELYLWCDEGVCSSPAAPGEPCTEGQWSCQFGYICSDGQCQPLGVSEVPVGDACEYSASCVAGAECLDTVCVQSDAACIVDQQCPEGQYCDTECLTKRADGEQCDGSSACVSGYCSDDGVCGDGNPCD